MKTMITVLFIGACFGLGACSNTANGLGQDMEKAGQSIQKTF